MKKFEQLRVLLAKAGFDGFMLALLLMIIISWVWPDLGKEDGLLPLDTIGTYGVSVIFFFYGLRLSTKSLVLGLSNWKLHLTIQLTTFLVFPLLIIAAYRVFGQPQHELLWLGTFFLAALPSTVSSSVVMVSIAGGNMPAAIFNASISGLIGVFVTPLWMGFFMKSQTGGFELTEVFIRLTLQVLAPVALGMIFHQKWGGFAVKHKDQLKKFDQIIILIIVLGSFSESFARDLFKGYSAVDLAFLCFLMGLLFYFIFGVVTLSSKISGFDNANKITAVFCGSKKSLVHGTVMSKVIFTDANIIGIVLLPLMLYHAIQLVISGIMAQSMARKVIKELD
jgi:solute carrier family 10 (sodium/bile acid cotransporter), member 7